MPSSEPTTPKLSVDDILAFSEAELVQYMKQNHYPDRGFDLDFAGWENLPKDQRDQLAERLRTGAQKANDAAASRQVDPGQLAAQLQEIADNLDALPKALSRPSRRSRSPTVEVDWDEEGRKSEIVAYNTLVNDGGQPGYPINLLEDVSKNPVEHREILRPWQDYPDASTPHWSVFQTQLRRWQDFRMWQEDNREMFNEEEEFAAFVEKEKRRDAEDRATIWRHIQMTENQWLKKLEAEFKRQSQTNTDGGVEGFSAFVKETKQKRLKSGLAWPGMTEDEYLKTLRNRFNLQQARRFWENFHWLREDNGRGGFPEYLDEVKRRFAKHGFTRTFQLDEDPKRQDKLTTWIEYLNYEYSWYDKYSRDVIRLQPQYDEAWQKLVDSGVLRPSETDEYLRSDESGFRDESEKDAARKAVEFAKSAARAVLISTQNESQRSSLTKPRRLQMMREAHARLDAAKKSLSAIRRRGDLITKFIQGTWDYKTAQRNVKCQSIRLQWILEQVPWIEAEMIESKAAEGSSDAECGTKRRFGRDQDDEVTTDINPTRRNGQSIRSDGRTGSTIQTRGRSDHSRRNDTADDERPSKRFRVDSQDSGFQRQASGNADATSTRGLQASGVSAARRQGSDSKAALKTSLAPSNRLLQPTDRPQRREAQDECGHDDTIDDKPISKRHETDRQLHRSHLQTPDEAETATIRRTPQSRPPARSKDIGKQEGGHQAVAPLRRSARIAAHQKPCKSPVVPSSSPRSLGQRPRRKARQAPTRPSSTGSQDRWSRSQAKKTSKRSLAGGIK
ncbi:hypothetical protein GQ53DRAFT_689303 [Thozetella sp. PMI_491]|nr:hypothetical protein GQ53DRAFT_689303 [Thozetella sp. PMI_491]